MVVNFLWIRNPREVPSFALESGTVGSTNQNPLPATGPGFALGPCHHSTAYCGQLQGSSVDCRQASGGFGEQRIPARVALVQLRCH